MNQFVRVNRVLFIKNPAMRREIFLESENHSLL